MTGAAHLLGVHANTVRAWTDQGRLRCLRINDRGDRRYRVADLRAFLEVAGVQSARTAPFVSRLQPRHGPWLALADGDPAHGTDGTPAAFQGDGSQPRDEAPARESAPATRASVGVRATSPASKGRGVQVRPGRTELPQLARGKAPARARKPSVKDSTASMVDTGATLTGHEETLLARHRSVAAPTEIAVLARLWNHQSGNRDLDHVIREATRALLDTGHFTMVGIAQWHDGRLNPRLVDGARRARNWWQQIDSGLVEVCIREGRPIAVPSGGPANRNNGRHSAPTVEVFSPIGQGALAWGVLIVESAPDRSLGRSDLDLLGAVAAYISMAADRSQLAERVHGQQLQARALSRITTDLNSRLDFPVIMNGLVDHAMSLFHADRAAIWRLVDGRLVPEFSRNLSRDYTDSLVAAGALPIGSTVLAAGQTMALTGVMDDPRTEPLRDAIMREGFDTVAVTPLAADGETLGILALYHDQRREWDPDDLQALEALAAQAAVAVKNARNYQQMATWAAQLQSIQQLGTRLNRLSTVTDIGQAIAAELRQLIDYHNVRVYRVRGDRVEPVAWRGEIGEYTTEDGEKLRLKVGTGITGWVAQNGIPQYLPDAARDPRAQTIPGTAADLDESMLLAPMLYEDRVIGVIVLSKLGLNQFSGDDLRYLEIYASIAGQAMVKADATEELRAQSDQLARQLASQRELMSVTESILSTLDPRAVVEEIADRLGGLLRLDNVGIAVYDADAHVLRPLFARGVDSERFMSRTTSDTEGLSGWVVRHGEARLVQSEHEDDRVIPMDGRDQPAAVIVAPLRARDRVTGALTLERIGTDARFEDQEFELIQLFAAHVSIALQNAEAHRAVEIRAQTDALTGLKNQGTFQEYVQLAVTLGDAFSLLIVDLDEFKAFNDRRGHEAGNVLLTEVGHALRAACRDSDEVFRYGGDEFALILPKTDIAGAMEVAAKVGRAVRSAPAAGSRKPSGVTCSIGVAGFPIDAADRATLLLAADRACYVAKRNGRNRAVTAAEGLALAGDVLPQPPTPVDNPTLEQNAA